MFAFGSKCRRVKRLLSDRIDAPLSTKDEAVIRAHLAECRNCRKELTFYEHLKKSSHTLEPDTPPPYLWERISLKLDEHPWGDEDSPSNNRISSAWRINLAGVFTSCLLITFLCLLPGVKIEDNDYPAGGLARAEEFNSNIEYLSLYMMANGDMFPPEVRDYYLNQVQALDHKIKMIKSALDRFPENRRIKTQLATAYTHKIALYRHIGAVNAERSAYRAGGFSFIQKGGIYD
jgi:hypothetical protein